MNECYLKKTIELADESLKTGDVPIGAIVIQNNEIVGFGWNTREKDQDILGHAEINALMMATKRINNWNLQGCDLYVSLKPCSMCIEIIKQCRISNVYYLLDKSSSKKEYYRTNFEKISNNFLESEYQEKISNFFAELREKNN